MRQNGSFDSIGYREMEGFSVDDNDAGLAEGYLMSTVAMIL